MRRIAIISDIHSNMPALNAVLADIAQQKVEAIYCLGDVVGYGPEPVAAMRTILDVCELGKVLATKILGEIESATEPALTHDTSTTNLIRKYRSAK